VAQEQICPKHTPGSIELDLQMTFLRTAIPSPPARILDAGCGRGELAARLATEGYEVRGVDAEAEAVKAARLLGIAATLADFMQYEDAMFDVLIFSRSLHHMHPLSAAVRQAKALLRAGGTLVVDEFAVDAVDRPTAAWFYDTLSLLEAAGVLVPDEEVPAVDDPLERWMAQHAEDPPLHSGKAMIAAVEEGFEITSVAWVPYLYSYFEGWLTDPARDHDLARQAFEIERRRTADGDLAAVGLRMVGLQRAVPG
jgi:SAM-dependent methyltransferase